MTNILGISGSARRGSFNTALLRAAAGAMPAGAELNVQTIRGIPVFDGDEEETHGIPAAAAALKELIAAADGVILATPEYNHSIPGAFKNAIDWLSRPSDDIKRVFGGKPVAVCGASPGPFGTILAQAAWLPVLHTLGTRPWCEGRLLVARAGSAFDRSGVLIEESAMAHLRQFLAGFVAFVRAAEV